MIFPLSSTIAEVPLSKALNMAWWKCSRRAAVVQAVALASSYVWVHKAYNFSPQQLLQIGMYF